MFGVCSKESLEKIQVMQNKLLKLLLNLDRYTPTNILHSNLSVLKVEDIFKCNIVSFVNECRSNRCPDVFKNYYKIRESVYELRHTSRLEVPAARIDIGQNRCEVKGARLWNEYFNVTNKYLYKKSFRKHISKAFMNNYWYLHVWMYVYVHSFWETMYTMRGWAYH